MLHVYETKGFGITEDDLNSMRGKSISYGLTDFVASNSDFRDRQEVL